MAYIVIFMRTVLLCFQPMPEYAKLLAEAFEEYEFKTRVISAKELALFTKGSKTKVIKGSRAINTCCAFLSVSLQLTQFAEPLLDEFAKQGIYCPTKPSAYYVCSNELLQMSMLNSYNIKVPRTIMFSSAENLNIYTKGLSYPAIFKAFIKERKIQSTIVQSFEELKKLVNGVEAENFMVREYITDELDYCAVIGNEVFNLKIPLKKNSLAPEDLKKAYPSKLSKVEEETALQAASVCAGDIATVTMCKGFVLRVKPNVNLALFTKKCSQNMFEKVAKLFDDKVSENG